MLRESCKTPISLIGINKKQISRHQYMKSVSLTDINQHRYVYALNITKEWKVFTVVPAKSDSDVMLCLQSI